VNGKIESIQGEVMPIRLRIRFGLFELDRETGEFWKHGRKVSLSPKPFRLLALLVSCPGQLVTRQTLKQHLWDSDTHVDFEHGLNFCIREIRLVLGDNARKPKFIETLPRRGYRFIGALMPDAHAVEPTSAVETVRPGNCSSSGAPVPDAVQLEAYGHYSHARKCLTQAGKETLEEACEYFHRAVILDPHYAMAHSGLGAAHALRNINRRDPADLEKAQQHLERALTLDRELAEPYPWLCYVYNRQGKLDAAVEAGNKAIHLQPDLVHAHYFLGLAYHLRCESGSADHQNAAHHLLSATRVGPGWQATWFVLAFHAGLVGDYAHAWLFGQRLLAMSGQPGGLPFVGAEIVLASIELRQGRPKAAIQFLEAFLERMRTTDHMYRDGMSVVAACGLGDVYLREGETAQALASYRRAWQLVQEHPRIMAHQRISARTLAGLSAAYFAQGDRKRASGLLQRALTLALGSAAPEYGAAGASLPELFLGLTVSSIRAGNRDQALDLLGRAVQSGWNDVAWLERDPELQPLHGEPRFQSALSQLRLRPAVDFESRSTTVS
jgi:DNA-binding winged helix-turn-helix (wHTH) protein/Flp pilus assembly protein TadD